jgi:hypothetical protein
VPLLPGSPIAQLIVNVAVVSYASAIVATGVTLLVIYVLEGFGLA